MVEPIYSDLDAQLKKGKWRPYVLEFFEDCPEYGRFMETFDEGFQKTKAVKLAKAAREEELKVTNLEKKTLFRAEAKARSDRVQKAR